jgi:hypothetical protein
MAILIHICFKSNLKNNDIRVATENIDEARRIARIWGERNGGEPVTRTIFVKRVPAPLDESEIVDGIKVWPPLF